MTTHSFTHNGNTVAYTRKGSGRPILFLHNGGTTKEIWTQQAEALQERYEVICLDHLGFGESDMPASGYSINDYVELLSAYIDHLGFDRISVVGNCMGSAMTLLLADQRPDIFDTLGLINPLSENTARRGVIGFAMPIAARLPRLSLWVSRQVFVPAFLTRFVVAGQYGPRGWRRGLRTPLPGAVTAGLTWRTRGRLAPRPAGPG